MTAHEIHRFIETRLLNGRQVEATENLLLSGLIDSLGVMTLVGHIEKEMGQTVPVEDVTLENFATVDAISGYLGLG